MIRMSKTTIFGITIFVVMLFTGIGYAFLSSNLSVNGAAIVSKKGNLICKRATSLHTGKCEFEARNDGLSCVNDGYSYNASMTFGRKGTTGLTPGDAFDCDVNGDGSYNATNERFYYISDLDSNTNYAVLIWYKSLSPGQSRYCSGDPLTLGPEISKQYLPTTSSSTTDKRWSNVSLLNQTRKIKDETGKEYINFKYTIDSSNVIFRARLATFQEITYACPSLQVRRGKKIKGSCEYLVENTMYHSTNTSFSRGYWLETVYPAKSLEGAVNNKAWVIDGFGHATYPIFPVGNDQNSSSVGIYFDTRPVIEVKKSQIDY